MAAGTLTYLSGSQSITGSFGRVYAITDSLISVSGSNVGQATFLLKAGTTFDALTTGVADASIANLIESVRVNSTYGFVLVQAASSQV